MYAIDTQVFGYFELTDYSIISIIWIYKLFEAIVTVAIAISLLTHTHTHTYLYI